MAAGLESACICIPACAAPVHAPSETRRTGLYGYGREQRVMDTQSFKTESTKAADVDRAWHVVDARDKTVGRLASKVAAVLRGKHKPTFTPHVDTGDYVIVVNAEHARFTGNKETDKEYRRYSGYPGGERVDTPAEMRDKHSDFLIRHAVKGMLPNGPLGRQMLKKLKIYAGAEHPHEAQQPTPLEV